MSCWEENDKITSMNYVGRLLAKISQQNTLSESEVEEWSHCPALF